MTATNTQPCTTCGHPAVEHVTGPTSLCIICPDGDQSWQHAYSATNKQ